MEITKQELFIILFFVILSLISELVCYLYFDNVNVYIKVVLICCNLAPLFGLWIYLKKRDSITNRLMIKKYC